MWGVIDTALAISRKVQMPQTPHTFALILQKRERNQEKRQTYGEYTFPTWICWWKGLVVSRYLPCKPTKVSMAAVSPMLDG